MGVHVEFLCMVVLALESLEAEDEDFGGFVDLHLLFGEDEVFAFGAVPRIVFSQGLGLTEEFEAFVDTGACLGWFAKIVINTIFIFHVTLTILHLLKLLLNLIYILPPVNLHIYLISFHSILEWFIIKLQQTAITLGFPTKLTRMVRI